MQWTLPAPESVSVPRKVQGECQPCGERLPAKDAVAALTDEVKARTGKPGCRLNAPLTRSRSRHVAKRLSWHAVISAQCPAREALKQLAQQAWRYLSRCADVDSTSSATTQEIFGQGLLASFLARIELDDARRISTLGLALYAACIDANVRLPRQHDQNADSPEAAWCWGLNRLSVRRALHAASSGARRAD